MPPWSDWASGPAAVFSPRNGYNSFLTGSLTHMSTYVSSWQHFPVRLFYNISQTRTLFKMHCLLASHSELMPKSLEISHKPLHAVVVLTTLPSLTPAPLVPPSSLNTQQLCLHFRNVYSAWHSLPPGISLAKSFTSLRSLPTSVLLHEDYSASWFPCPFNRSLCFLELSYFLA